MGGHRSDLHNNNVGDAGAASLASALEKNATLQELYLDHNGVGDAGAASLASALEQNATLLELSFGGNDVGAAGAASLARIASALERNSSTASEVVEYYGSVRYVARACPRVRV